MVGQNNQQNLVLVIREREEKKGKIEIMQKEKKFLRRRIRISINAQIGTG